MPLRLKQFQCFISVLFHHVRRALHFRTTLITLIASRPRCAMLVRCYCMTSVAANVVLIRGFIQPCRPLIMICTSVHDKKAQLSLTNPRNAKVCQKLLQLFDVFTTLSLTILAYLHSFSCCCVRNPAKFTKNSNLWSSRVSKVIDFIVNGKPICDFILVINSNFSRICYRFRDIHS